MRFTFRRKTPDLLKARESRSVGAIPLGEHWQYEPKWDGFRCLLRRVGDQIVMQSKSVQDLKRHFSEVERPPENFRKNAS